MILAEGAGRLSYQTQLAGAVRSGHHLFLSTRYLLPKFPEARTCRNILVNDSGVACSVDVFVQFFLAVCSHKVL